MHHEPATTIIAKFGGVRKVAAIAEVTVHTVTKWRLAKEKGGTGGYVPHWHHDALLTEAEKQGIQLAPEDFARPRSVAA